jgi:hypothetical protein
MAGAAVRFTLKMEKFVKSRVTGIIRSTRADFAPKAWLFPNISTTKTAYYIL